MKIALVSEWLDEWRGGAETSTLQFAQHLLGAGVELHVFTRSRPSPTPRLHVHTVSGAAMSRTRQSATFSHRVDRILQRESYDIVHAITPCLRADVYQPRGGTVAETIARNIALRPTGSARAMKRCANYFNLKQRHALALERKLLTADKPPLVVAISQYVVRQLREQYSLPDAFIRPIYNGVNPDNASAVEKSAHRAAIRREFGIREEQFLVLLIAHNFRLKGVHRWMEAMSALLQSGGHGEVRSLVVGKGDSPGWHRFADQLGLANYLTFTGPTQRVVQFLHAADVLVHPTYYDPCSRVVLEAMVAGLPCITTRWDGASEMILDGVNGFVIDDPEDITALVARVDSLRCADVRKDMAEQASLVRDRVSMVRHTQELLLVYQELLGHSARTADVPRPVLRVGSHEPETTGKVS